MREIERITWLYDSFTATPTDHTTYYRADLAGCDAMKSVTVHMLDGSPVNITRTFLTDDKLFRTQEELMEYLNQNIEATV